MPTAEVTIIGAGPYGLSISAHLRARNARFEIAGCPMESWRSNMPKGMFLKSEPFASNLWDPRRRYTLERFSREHGKAYEPVGSPVALADFLAYAAWFQERTAPPVRERRLVWMDRAPGGFALSFDGGERVRTGNVVLATGGMRHRWTPAELLSLPRGVLLHSSELVDAGALAGREVIVIGAGQSAVLSAALLHEAGARTLLVARRGEIDWNERCPPERPLYDRLRWPQSGLAAGWRSLAYSELPSLFARLPERLRLRIVERGWGPSGAWWLKDRVAGRVPALMRHVVERAWEQGGRAHLRLRNGSGSVTASADHVVAATGYRHNLGHLDFLAPPLRDGLQVRHAAPVLSPCFESSVAGLFFVGIPSVPTFGPVMRFMFGAKRPAAVLARRFGRGWGAAGAGRA